jgi:hydroxypyruvate isomerase
MPLGSVGSLGGVTVPRFSANLSFLFTELPWERRFDAAAAAGFKAVELNLPAPYQFSPEEFNRRLFDAGLACIAMLAPGGNGGGREMGLAALCGATDPFRGTISRALEYAQAARVQVLHVLAGLVPDEADRSMTRRLYVEGLQYAADAASRVGVTIGIEPVSRFRFPKYFVNTTPQAVDLIARIGRANLTIIYDVFQAQMEEGRISASLSAHIDQIGVIQVGNPPGRHEPGRGEIDFPFLFGLIDDLGFDGWVACEYFPSTSTLQSLEWARPWGIGSPPSSER